MGDLVERLRDFDVRFSAMAAKHNWTRKFGLAAIVEASFSSEPKRFSIDRGKAVMWIMRFPKED